MELALDPKTTALVLIDLQKAVVGRQLSPHSSADVVHKSARLAAKLRKAGGTVVYVHVKVGDILDRPVDTSWPRGTEAPPADASDLVPEAGFTEGDYLVAKKQWGAFYGTGLDQILRRCSVQTIVLCGIATNFGVESTARAANDIGYHLVFAEDAMSGITEEAHRFAVDNIFTRMGRVRSTEEILMALN